MQKIGNALFFLIISLECYAQVNLQTGAAEQNFPLINYSDTKSGIMLGVGLSYSSGNGLQVNEIASDIGTGWSLDAGGVIIRMQNGEPDDQQAFFSGSQFALAKGDETELKKVLKSYPNGFLYNPNIGKGCNIGQNYYPVFDRQKVYKERNTVAGDVEQDRFIFRVNGRSGMFIIGKNFKVTTLGDSRMKISFSTSDMTSQGIRTTINQFIITTEDGIKYIFNEKGLSNICRYKLAYTDVNGKWVPHEGDAQDGEYAINRFWGFPLTSDERPFVVNSWFLSSIENTNTGQKVFFNYQDVYQDLIQGKVITHQRNLNYSRSKNQHKRNKYGQDWFKLLSNPINAQNYSWNINELNRLKPASTSIVYNHSVISSKRILNISLPNGGSINFIYNNIGRVDFQGEHALSKIEYYIKGEKIRSYELTHGYFYRNTIQPYEYGFSSFDAKFTRLCLLSIQKIGNGMDNSIEPPYKFNYYTGEAGKSGSADDIVPAQNFLSQDHWGYYNGSNSGLSSTEDHDFLNDQNNQYFKTVLPKYKNPKNGYAKNGILKIVTYPTGGSLEYTYEQNIPSQNLLPSGNPQLAGGVSVSKTTLFDGEDVSKNIITSYNYKNETGVSTRWGDEAPSYYSFNVNKYDIKFFRLVTNKPGLSYPEMATSPDVMKIIGKALLQIVIGIAIDQLIKGAIYLIAGSSASSIIPYVNIAIFVYAIVKLIIEFTTPIWSHRFILSNTNNTSFNPLPTFYSKVEVTNNSPNGYNGKTVYQFTDLTDFPALIPKMEWPYIQTQRLASWAYGLPKAITVYDKNNTIIKQDNSNYNYIAAQVANQNNLSCNCATLYKESQKAKNWQQNENTEFTFNPYLWTTPRRYFPYTGRTDILSSEEKSYINGSLYYSNVSNIITDPMTLLQKGTMIQKDKNSVVFSITYYPTDFNIAGSAIEKLKDNNAIYIPINVETWIMKTNPGNVIPKYTLELLDDVVTEFSLYNFGVSPNIRQEVKPYRTYRLKSKTPVASSVIGTHNPNTLLRVPSLYKIQTEMIYDNDGNLVQTKTDNLSTSYVNDYSSRYVVASVSNASVTDIAYAGFESDGSGNWNYNQAFIKSSKSITGMKAFQLGYDPVIGSSSTVSISGISTSKIYTVSYWLRYTGSESVSVNGQTGTLLYSGIDGWRLYSRDITGTTSISISGTGLIDELRLYPKGALMSTVSYKEGIGKISECDANNRILYYEYDGLGRLILIKDQNKNVIKTYEYNYKK
jgi:hypothetical protein